MKFASLLAALALPAATSAFDLPNFLRGSGVTVLSDLEGNGIQPEYCRGAPGNPEVSDDDNFVRDTPDFRCYKDGWPKCCSKNKGTCPYGQIPNCECDGDCSPGNGPDDDDNTDDTDRDLVRCIRNNECETNEFCRKLSGRCNNGSEGVCEEYPRSCNNQYNPVCGCDGRTYSNDCDAFSDGISIKYYGEC